MLALPESQQIQRSPSAPSSSPLARTVAQATVSQRKLAIVPLSLAQTVQRAGARGQRPPFAHRRQLVEEYLGAG
ncbi:hypothetical protein IQ273_01940 [Nodosilinea sp. LEGE 07298]|nr:hypothetical protein [Nodosilinea sp. LEGE 07298]